MNKKSFDPSIYDFADNAKIMLVGIDGATWSLIRPWIDEDRLPNFKKLINEGTWGVLKSTVPPLSPAAWASILTGLKPTTHTIWSFVKQKRDSYYIRPITSKDIKGDPLWKILTSYGIRSIFINVPFFYPPSEFNGIITTGLGTPSTKSDFTFPLKIKDEILNNFPDYNVDFNEDRLLLNLDKNIIIDEIFKITNANIEAFKYFYEKELHSTRVFSVILRSLDVIQHFFWDNKEVVFKFYNRIDTFLKWCLETKNDDDILLICSDHGFRHIEKKFYINEWLKHEGFLNTFSHNKNFLKKIMPSGDILHKLLINLGFRDIVWKIKHSKYLEKIAKIIPTETFSYYDIINWEETQAYYHEGSSGIIEINLITREPKGLVSYNNYDEVRENVIRKISEFRDNETNNKVFEYVKKGEEIYGDDGGCPDIICYPKVGYALSGGFHKQNKMIDKERERKGDHDVDGIICIYGHKVGNYELLKMKVWDVTPLVLSLLNIPIQETLKRKATKPERES